MYKLLRDLLFLFPPEGVHHFSMKALKWICKSGYLRRQLSMYCKPESSGPGLERTVFGLSFRNPVGLGAGFDKNALYLNELDALGFGFVEVGTVTPLPQAGNDRPRLFRLKQDQALINRMGFNNDGAEMVAGRLKAWQAEHSDSTLIVGGNIGKNKSTPNEDAWKDYESAFRCLFDHVDYFVVNVSSPNTPGLRELQEKDALRRILTNLQAVGRQLSGEKGKSRPLLLKIAPDLGWQQIDEIIDLALEIKLDGLVAVNTTTSRQNLLTAAGRLESIGGGGVSGAPLKERSTDILRYIHARTRGSIPLIASGGIFSGEDANQKLAAGASLVQIWTAFIYEGPRIVHRICADLTTGNPPGDR
ncbi:MAG: quinone-dependent dihydroorotate dehydrogenase [Bacteroidota bacterium]|nr:quinone-dependent dihydroorotate dehydrogenase [Bacteroidota bacterium]MDP4215197.1 quinone-dependent dihydroorotate dehydrogenase [Bacteroidota bacterium]MDP4244974.1 quinone-dependent dihydroorotate dehydrogenase [Bacteroidota bacterium]MDP4255287.1 quinone-dependent dihydroorotate dehydrogenase [Bacteroidota bacterium]MDP4256719.1 quinone-dependent dihydroorotate dehydrogenase [Bacteroidota bacterium]